MDILSGRGLAMRGCRGFDVALFRFSDGFFALPSCALHLQTACLIVMKWLQQLCSFRSVSFPHSLGPLQGEVYT